MQDKNKSSPKFVLALLPLSSHGQKSKSCLCSLCQTCTIHHKADIKRTQNCGQGGQKNQTSIFKPSQSQKLPRDFARTNPGLSSGPMASSHRKGLHPIKLTSNYINNDIRHQTITCGNDFQNARTMCLPCWQLRPQPL
jgi:hypothetical protein